MANTSVSLVSLDFDTLKSSLKTYLSTQSQFRDYDFEGANINVLLDILSYNTYLNAFYLNMVSTEMFLDSAQLKNSVVSRAKELNYTPRSYKSSKNVLVCQFPQSNLTSLSIPAGTNFSGKNSNNSYNFITEQSQIVYPSGGFFTANVNVFEGSYTTDAYVIDYTIEGQRYPLVNPTADTSSLIVTVLENNAANVTIFQQATNLFGLNAKSNVYFIQAGANSQYEVIFGDGILGRIPLNNSVIRMDYVFTSGTDGNGCKNFILNDNLGVVNGLGSAIIPSIVSGASYGGANSESIESIRFNAPRSYQTQNSAVTTNDYKMLILSNFPDIKNVYVYGGETVTNSVQFGRVLISPITYSGSFLSQNEKSDIITFISNKNTVGITPAIVDPDFLYILVNSTIKYDTKSTKLSQSDIYNIVSNQIIAFNSANLIDFNKQFNISRFETAINAADSSIITNDITLTMMKSVSPAFNTLVYMNIFYHNSILPGSMSSSTFLSGNRSVKYTDYNPNNNTFSIKQSVTPGNGITLQNTTNNVYLVDLTNPQYSVYTIAGSINYITGMISLNQIIVNDFLSSSGIQFYSLPFAQDVQAYNNDIIQINIASGITINVVGV
jgi:hypothetical protein